jgi:DNA helicase HerA-like ATPase
VVGEAPIGAERESSGQVDRAIGQVIGTEDATPLMFHVALYPDAYLQLDDVVATTRDVPGRGSVTTSGIVTQVRSRHEGATFGSDVFLVSEGVLPARVQEIAEVTTTRVEPELYVPPQPGAPARRATGLERSEALYFDQMQRRLPVGTGRDGEIVYVDLDFIDGSRGAHISISGISGVATKTSFALFLLHSLFSGGVLRHAHNAKALIFSVKGEDLLFLDKPNNRLSGEDGDRLRDSYAQLGLPATPFQSVGFFAPPTPGDNNARPYVTGRTEGVEAFWWTLDEFCSDGLLPYVFADAEDERNQYTLVIHHLTGKLRREAVPAGNDGAVSLDGMLCRTYSELVDLLCERVTDPGTMNDWAGPAIGGGTANAFVRRLRSSQRALSDLIRGDIPDRATRQITTQNHQVTVVDLHNLTERAQRFVTGVVLAAETARKEAAGPGSLLFTMLDELNKYAPREGASPIKDVLLDIAERGRSLGIILIGAQQTASEVERRIISNSAIKVVGRLDSAEASRPEYGFLPSGQRMRATIAKPGAMFVNQPAIPVPLAVEFPFPAWATRQSEVDSSAVGGAAVGTSTFGTARGPVDRGFPARLPQPDDAPF